MCFAEFIGYTCGHTSYEVLRPCPLTTMSPSSPICTLYARRPFLAREMCPACQRILYRRADAILKGEHRWMHERGVCGCRIYLPNLPKNRVTHRIADYVGGDGASVHSSTFYRVEWVEDHRQLHKDGACMCAGDFTFYKTPELYRIAAVQVERVKSMERAEALEDLYSILKQQGRGRPSSCASIDSDWTTYHPPVVDRPEKGDVDAENASLGKMTQYSSPSSGWSRPCDPMFDDARKQGAKMKHPFVDCQTVEYPQPQVVKIIDQEGGTTTTVVGFARPLVGLPIGAGPEATPSADHVGAFKRCVLHRQKRDDDLVDATVSADPKARVNPLRPLRRSHSFDVAPGRLTDVFFYGAEETAIYEAEAEEYWATGSVGGRPRENTGFPEYSDSDSDEEED